MTIKNLIQYLPWSSKLSNFYSECCTYLAKIEDSKPFQLFIEHERQIATIFYIMWLAGFGYWFYELIIIDVEPGQNLGFRLTDSRDALVILFFGIIGIIFVSFCVFFIIKLIYNLFHDGMESLFPSRWHEVIKPISYLLILYFVFPYTGTIKMTGLTAYNQVVEIVETSRHQGITIKKEVPVDIDEKILRLIELMEKEEKD